MNKKEFYLVLALLFIGIASSGVALMVMLPTQYDEYILWISVISAIVATILTVAEAIEHAKKSPNRSTSKESLWAPLVELLLGRCRFYSVCGRIGNVACVRDGGTYYGPGKKCGEYRRLIGGG